MKKLIALILLSAITVLPAMADKVRICLWPENKEVSNSIGDYFPPDMVELCSAVIKPDASLMKTGDKRLMDMMCRSADCDVLVIPYTEAIDDFSHNTLFVYQAEDGSFTKVLENIQDNVSVYDEKEVASALADVILNADDAEKVKAFIVSGPVLDLPNIVITEKVKPAWLKDKTVFSTAKHDFYTSFAATLGAFGVKVLINAYNADNNKYLNIANGVSTAAIAICGTMMLRNLFDYCRYADFVSP